MNNENIRQVEGEEILEVVHKLPGYAFRSSPPLQEKDAWQEVLDLRPGYLYFALYEGSQPVACVARAPMTQHVRGRVLPMGGIYDVVTHPAARRKGYATQLMKKIYAAMREEGRPVTSLYPFRESFYERLGYVSFAQPRRAKLLPANLGGLIKRKLDGEVTLALVSEGYDEYRAFLENIQQRQQGMGLFENRPLSPGKRNNFWIAFARAAGEVVGVMDYNLRGEREMEFDLRALRFYYLNNQGRYLLLDWIARHVDQARSVEILLSPAEQPETWLVDLQVKVTGEDFTGMGRVLDVAGLSGLQTGAGSFRAQIRDPHCPWNEGIWHFESMDGMLEVSRAQQADCTLTIQGLSSLVYGPRDPRDIPWRGWGDPSPELQAVMRSMFPSVQPYLHEFF